MDNYSKKKILWDDMHSLRRIRGIKLYAQRLLRATMWIEKRICNRLGIPLVVLLFVFNSYGQRGVGSNPAAIQAPVSVFKQRYLRWDNSDVGTSNRISWGLLRDMWTNGSRVVFTNEFPVTNGWHYKVTSMFNGFESIPALWPSNRVDRIWVQTSTNLTTWKDGFVWQTNYNMPQEFLRLRAETIKWE